LFLSKITLPGACGGWETACPETGDLGVPQHHVDGEGGPFAAQELRLPTAAQAL